MIEGCEPTLASIVSLFSATIFADEVLAVFACRPWSSAALSKKVRTVVVAFSEYIDA
jgi:hypothetical protein